MIRDFADRRARSRSCDNTWVDVLFVAVPATVAALFGAVEQFAKWLAFSPTAVVLLQIGLPLVGTIATFTVITSIQPSRAAGFEPANSASQPTYRFCPAIRQTAKLAFFPLLWISAASVWSAVPNALRGTRQAGFVCTAKGTALNGAFVQLADRFGQPISGSAQTDDRGFFVAELSRWKSRPVDLRITGDCKRKTYPLADAARGLSCPSEQIESPQLGKVPVWITDCR